MAWNASSCQKTIDILLHRNLNISILSSLNLMDRAQLLQGDLNLE